MSPWERGRLPSFDLNVLIPGCVRKLSNRGCGSEEEAGGMAIVAEWGSTDGGLQFFLVWTSALKLGGLLLESATNSK